MPGRPRKPLKLLKLQGTSRKDRHGGRQDLDLDNDPPEPPDYFGEDALAEWYTLVNDSQYSTVLAQVDRGMMELYCALRAEFKRHLRAGTEMQSSRMMVMANVAGKLGLNPSDRTKVAVPKQPEPDDEWAEFAAGCRSNRFAALDAEAGEQTN